MKKSIQDKNIFNTVNRIDPKQLDEININFLYLWEMNILKIFRLFTTLFLEDKNLDSLKKVNKKSQIIIWTKKNDKNTIENNDNIKKIGKYIKINYFIIDTLLEYLSSKTTKYEFLYFTKFIYYIIC